MTPRDDWESLFARKKSDSSLSAGAGEFEDEDECDSFWSSGTGSESGAGDPAPVTGEAISEAMEP
jgi:hypothetical protein